MTSYDVTSYVDILVISRCTENHSGSIPILNEHTYEFL